MVQAIEWPSQPSQDGVACSVLVEQGCVTWPQQESGISNWFRPENNDVCKNAHHFLYTISCHQLCTVPVESKWNSMSRSRASVWLLWSNRIVPKLVDVILGNIQTTVVHDVSHDTMGQQYRLLFNPVSIGNLPISHWYPNVFQFLVCWGRVTSKAIQMSPQSSWLFRWLENLSWTQPRCNWDPCAAPKISGFISRFGIAQPICFLIASWTTFLQNCWAWEIGILNNEGNSNNTLS